MANLTPSLGALNFDYKKGSAEVAQRYLEENATLVSVSLENERAISTIYVGLTATEAAANAVFE